MKRYILLVLLVILEIWYYLSKDVSNLDLFFSVWTMLAVFAILMIYVNWGNETPYFSAATGTSKETYMMDKKNTDSKASKKYKGLMLYLSYLLLNVLGIVLVTLRVI